MSKLHWGWFAGLALAVTATLIYFGSYQRPGQRPVQARVSASAMEVSGFRRAQPGREFLFPQDQGAHPEYQTEWWYYTGNLQTDQGRAFGYQLTFFRRGLLPFDQVIDRESDWAASQVYLAHFTLSDIAVDEFSYTERVSRGAAGLAGAVVDPLYSVWLDDWSVIQVSDDRYELSASDGSVEIILELVDEKGPVLQGNDGYSQKGAQTGNASHYYSQTRLRSRGTVVVGGEVFPVEGLSWMDHEFSTSALAPDQVGWDWFSLQLDDGTELMVYTIRDQDGQVDPYSLGSLIRANGEVIPLSSSDYTIDVLNTWRSPASGTIYPSGWRISIPSQEIQLEITPLMADQELSVSFTYWEGAVTVTGVSGGAPVRGRGYVELTGYAHSMQGEF